MDNEKLKSNLLSADHWMRLVFMILISVILYVAGIVMSILVVVQFVFALVTGKDNPNLRQLGDSLSQFIYAALRFLTYNTDDKPFPFADWPQPSPIEETEEEEKPAVADVEEAKEPEADSDKKTADK